MSRSINSEVVQRLFFTLIPLPQGHCRACGYVPHEIEDETIIAALDERGLCPTCAYERSRYAHTKMMRGRK